ncbi:hypothetical protein OCGS_1445 [Oceaniovalibus guishaninsula JLT2003]|uniref:Uncharacterized protein n=1 Tax=Oceaniovalibus guishaninsula JLT2003 TaxID=1231392 RepID=K2HDJ5_9RHOB|nr:hypothetical protein [Oceaniovalibus guishaninsula]EKE44607.1 hypothetical protein OCGS_1445 [Oceaniovalibus guishaninsula JLT2003]
MTVRAVRRTALGSGLVALASVAGLVLLAMADPLAAARGWLAGWVFALSVATGSAVVIHIHTLTGGRWRLAGDPWLGIAAAATPALALGGAVVFAARDLLYPWINGAGPWGEVGALWLNMPFWTLRLVLILAVWAGIALVAMRRAGPVVAAVALVLYGVTISVAGVDWLLSLAPGFTSTDFAAMLAITQIACAFALPAVLGLSGADGQARSDWGALLLTGLLGVVYLAGMQFLVSWSGDLPGKAAWYLARNRGPGLPFIWAMVLLGAVAPLAILVRSAWRGSVPALRVAGALVLAGAAAHTVWIVAPLSDPAAFGAIPAALLAAALLASLGRLAVGPRWAS